MKRLWLPRLTTGVSGSGCWGEGLIYHLDFVLYLLKKKKKKKYWIGYQLWQSAIEV